MHEGVFVYRPLQKGDIMELFAPGKKLPKNVNLQKVGISTYQNLTFCIGKNFNANSAKKRSKEVLNKPKYTKRGSFWGGWWEMTNFSSRPPSAKRQSPPSAKRQSPPAAKRQTAAKRQLSPGAKR